MISRRIIAALIAALLLMGCVTGALATGAELAMTDESVDTRMPKDPTGAEGTPASGSAPEREASPESGAAAQAGAPEPETTPEPRASEAPGPSVEPTSEPVEEPEPVRLYVVLVDCGFAFYGSSRKFDNSAVAYPADPQGHVVACAKEALRTLAEPDARVVAYGYHSNLVEPEAIAPAPVTNPDGMFARLQTQNRDTYFSSALDEGLRGLNVADWNGYDVTLVVFSGGVLNAFRNANYGNMKTDIANELSALRAAGVKVRAICLDQSLLLKEPAQAIDARLFGQGEYIAVPVAAEGDIRTNYNRALQQMAADFIDLLLADRGETWTRLNPEVTVVPDSSETEVVTLDKTGNLSRTSFGVYSEDTDRDADTIAWVEALPAAPAPEEMADRNNGAGGFLATGETAGQQEEAPLSEELNAAQGMAEGTTAPDVTATQAAQVTPPPVTQPPTMEEIVSDLIRRLHGELDGRTLTEAFSISLDSRIVPGKYSFYTDETDVVEVSTENGSLVLRPVGDGEAKLWCKDLDRNQVFAEDVFRPGITVEMPKPEIDYHLTWSWDGAADPLKLNLGEALPALTVTASEGNLECTLEKAGGEPLRLTTGQGELEGLKWSLDQNEAGLIALTLTPTRIGSYKVSCRLLSLDETPEEVANEARSIDVHQPLDPVEPLEIYYPYYLKNGLASLRLTSGGQIPPMGDYAIQAPEGLEVMTRTGAEANVLYVVPRSTGEMTLTVTERDVRDPATLEIPVRVRAVTSQISLWLLGLGALVCVAGLSAALVILIGKALGRRE